MQASSARGFTLVELMVGLAVAAILVSITMPSFEALVSRMRLTGVANELATDLQYARAEAVRLRAAVRLTPLAGGAGYELIGPDTNGDGAPDTLKAVAFGNGVTLAATADVLFDPLRATSTSVDLNLTNSAGVVRVRTSLMGRVTMCAASGSLASYPPC